MFHVCIAHCMPEKINKMSKRDNSCLFVWSTVGTTCIAMEVTDGVVLTEETMAVDDADVTVTLLPKN